MLITLSSIYLNKITYFYKTAVITIITVIFLLKMGPFLEIFHT